MAQQGKSGGAKKIGRAKRKPSSNSYKLSNRRFKNKLKRVTKSSGEKAAEEYARNYRGKQFG